MQERSAHRRDAVGLEQRSELLLDALADGADVYKRQDCTSTGTAAMAWLGIRFRSL